MRGKKLNATSGNSIQTITNSNSTVLIKIHKNTPTKKLFFLNENDLLGFAYQLLTQQRHLLAKRRIRELQNRYSSVNAKIHGYF